MKKNNLKIITLILSFGMAFNISSMEETEKVREKEEIKEKRKNFFEDEQELKRVKLDKNYLKKLPPELQTMLAQFVAGSVKDKEEIKETIRNISNLAQTDKQLRDIIKSDEFQKYLLKLVQRSFPELSRLGAKILINNSYWANKLKQKAEANKALRDELSARLVMASAYGNTDNVKFLLKSGAEPDYYFDNTSTRFNIGADAKILNDNKKINFNIYNADKIERLFNAEADNTEKITALMAATIIGHKNIIKLLLEAGADVNAVDENNNIALMFAITSNETEIVELLLKHGSRADIQGDEIFIPVGDAGDDHMPEEGYTPLILATQEGQKKIVKLLLESGKDVNVNQKDSEDHTALSWAKFFLNIHKESLQRCFDFPSETLKSVVKNEIEEVKKFYDIVEMIKDYNLKKE